MLTHLWHFNISVKVRELVKTLLEGLVPKQEAGKTLRCRDLIHYFKAFVNILNRWVSSN